MLETLHLAFGMNACVCVSDMSVCLCVCGFRFMDVYLVVLGNPLQWRMCDLLGAESLLLAPPFSPSSDRG